MHLASLWTLLIMFIPQVPLLIPTECIELLGHCLASKKRQLVPTQEEVALRVFRKCPLPLYLQFLMSSIVCWKSYTLALSWNQTLPPPDLKGTGMFTYIVSIARPPAGVERFQC